MEPRSATVRVPLYNTLLFISLPAHIQRRFNVEQGHPHFIDGVPGGPKKK